MVIETHLRASGGRAALLALTSISRIGTIEFFGPTASASETFRYHTDIEYPTRLREELTGARVLVDRGTDGTAYWEWTGEKYESVADPLKQTSMRETAERANRDVLWLTEEIGPLKMAATNPAWAAADHCLEGWKNSERVYACFDRATGLMTAKGCDEEYRLLIDWTLAGAIKIPMRLRHFRDGKLAYEVRLDRVEVDQGIERKRFENPTSP